MRNIVTRAPGLLIYIALNGKPHAASESSHDTQETGHKRDFNMARSKKKTRLLEESKADSNE